MMARRALLPLMIAFPLLLLLPPSVPAQQGSNGAAALRVGPHAGVQTSVLRYAVLPYSGEFQSTVEQGGVYGLSMVFPISVCFRLQADLGWWDHSWSVRHEGDPAVEIDRGDRTMVEFPILLHYHPRELPVPVYVAVGPVVSLLADTRRTFTVTHTGFTERDGWRSSSRDYEEETLQASLAGELGLEVPFADGFSLQMAVRFSQALGNTIDEPAFMLRELSTWRFRAGLLFSL